MANTTSTSSTRTGSKRRAPMSCDRCKSRKTKCVDPVPGPCQFCASINAVCHLDPSRRRQRPYYHVSEEEFRYMTKALEHFLPNVELNLHTLREIVQSFETASATAPPTVTLSGKVEPGLTTLSETSSADSAVAVSEEHSRRTPTSVDETIKSDNTAGSIEEIDELHGELGWLRVDSRGNYRHVGADSGYGFHAAVRSLHQRRSDARKSDIVTPFKRPLPCSDSESPGPVGVSGRSPRPSPSTYVAQRKQIFLPRRDLCNRCVSRFFRDIQSVYWFVSAERFYAALDRLYAGDPASATPSMLCSLYSILALTCESEGQAAFGELNDPTTPAPPPAARYLSLAKTFVSALCDEADIDSIRAFCLLGLALQSSMYSDTAYIYLGIAARISLTLGLHLQRAIEPRGCLQRQLDQRLYSTLYVLDLDVALCYGNPPAISEDYAAGKPSDLSEQILSPGSYMPLDYLTVICELKHIKRQLGKLLYGRTPPTTSTSTPTAPASPRPSIASVSNLLSNLTQWYTSIPAHLRDINHAATYHHRSVSVLILRFYSTTIFATRPFLLYSALHAEDLESLPRSKRTSFQEFSSRCLDAATQALVVIERMRDEGLLSSLTTLDTGFVLEVLQVFLLALARGQTEQADHVRSCLRTLQEMEQLFWTSHALKEVMAQLQENGLLNQDHTFSPQGETPGHFFLNISQQQQNSMMSGVIEAYFSDIHDPFFPVQNESGSTPIMIGDQFPDSMHDAMPVHDSMQELSTM